jgi:hypothetical protein
MPQPPGPPQRRYSPSTRGFYDLEVNGNIPEDAVDITVAEYEEMLAGQVEGKRIVPGPDGHPMLVDPPPPTEEQREAALTAQVQQRLDDFAKSRGYDNILSACSYATSSNPIFAAEGQYCVTARDMTWAAFYAILESLEALPESIADIEGGLPTLAWPDAEE